MLLVGCELAGFALDEQLEEPRSEVMGVRSSCETDDTKRLRATEVVQLADVLFDFFVGHLVEGRTRRARSR